jgi:hypothetical protein
VEAAQERNSTLVELEAMQNDLIGRLDDLDQRVCRVLKEWTATRESEAPASFPDPPEAGHNEPQL